MSTATIFPISEYLRTSYEPDAEYVDGHIEERPMGEKDHNWIQRKLLFLLNTPACEPFFDCIQEQRVRVDEETVRVPDLVLLRDPDPQQQVVATAPLLCIEVLSPLETMTRTLVRARVLLRLGAPEVWIFDPGRRTVHIYNGSELITLTEGSLTVPETPITISIEEVFSALTPKAPR